VSLPRRLRAPRWAYQMELALLRAIKQAKEEIVSNLDDSIQRNTQAVADAVDAATEEITQLREALADSATPEQIARIDAATQALGEATAALQGDDPAPPAPGA
jgi:type IV secretory pathway VirD2 relaxase